MKYFSQMSVMLTGRFSHEHTIRDFIALERPHFKIVDVVLLEYKYSLFRFGKQWLMQRVR